MDLAGDRGRLRVDLDERLGAGGRAAHEDALGAGLRGAVLAVEDVDEAVVVAVDAERLREALGLRGRHHAGAEHDQVRPQHALAGRGDVLDLDDGPAGAVELHLGRRAAQELDAGLAGAEEPVLVAHAGGPHLEVADGDLHLGEQRLEPDRVLERDHAAEARAVRQVALVARPGALDHDELLDRHPAERRLALPVVEHGRELHLGHDALVVPGWNSE